MGVARGNHSTVMRVSPHSDFGPGVMGIRVYLTGRLTLEVDEVLVIDQGQFRGRQARLAFTYLVGERNRAVPTEELANVVWPGELAGTWDLSLSSLISRLRSLLSVAPLKAAAVSLSRGSGQYKLSMPADTWTDLDAAAAAIDEADGAIRAGEPTRLLGPATVAVNVSRRPFLSGIEGDWVDSQRRKLERQLLRGLDCLTTMWLARAEPDLAVETAVEAIERDPFRESSYQLLMKAYALGEKKPKAISVYHRLRKLLGRELGTNPSAETDAIYKGLLG